jgi:hypothetical protein
MKHFLLLSFLFSVSSFAQNGGDLFPTDKAMAEIEKTYPGKKILVQNHYFPKPGKLDEVLALRITASKLLKEFGLSAGRVMVNRQTMEVTWFAEYESLDAIKTELKSFTAEKENRFKKEILSKMKPLIDGFKRSSNYVVFE